MSKIIIHKNCTYLSRPVLDEHGIEPNTSKTIFKRNKVNVIVENGISYLAFDAIPKPTQDELLKNGVNKTSLLAEYHLQQHESKVNTHFDALHFAHTKGYIKHLEPLKAKYPTLVRKKINEAAKLLAVWSYIIDNEIRDNYTLWQAFNKIYPIKKGGYANEISFAQAKSKAMKHGAEFMAIDQRWFTTPLNVKEVSIVNQYWAAAIISIGKKYSNRNVLKKVVELCKQSNEIPPSLSWIGKYRNQILKGNYSINESRNGKEAAKATQQTFAKMQHALHANDQWQMDGWTLPFWVDGFKRYVIVIVRDAYSKKIVGSAVIIC